MCGITAGWARALRQLSDYGIGLSPNGPSPEKTVEDLVSFLPVLAYDGSRMTQVDAGGILDIAMVKDTKKEKKELTEEEKEYKSKRKQIQEKLIKFATRIPAFMYLTDFRENTLQDVVTNMESDLFRTVTGLTVEDFNLPASLNVFNSGRMNQAVFSFRRYEDASLSYAGIDSHEDLRSYGLYELMTALYEHDEVGVRIRVPFLAWSDDMRGRRWSQGVQYGDDPNRTTRCEVASEGNVSTNMSWGSLPRREGFPSGRRVC